VVVFAQTGSGKSFLLKLLVRRALAHGIDAIVIDEASQEYLPLCQDLAEQGQYVRLGARGVRINPFELPPAEDDTAGDTDRESLAREHVGSSLLPLLELLLGALTEEERAILDLALVATYAACTERTPRMADLLEVLRQPRQPPQNRLLRDADPAQLRGLAVRLARWVEGALGELFSGPTTVALDRPLTVVNLASLGSAQLPMGIHLLNTFVFTRVRQAKAAGRWRPTLLVQDEAWSILQHPAGGTFLNGLARKARKYWLGLVSASQSPATV
jgi:type IV secretory pathway VirB4 component